MSTLHSEHPQECGRWPLWVGLLGLPVAWLFQLQVNYALVPWACQSGNLVPLHIASAFFLACALAAGFTAFSSWNRERREQMRGEPAAQCRLFMAKLGIMTGLLFSALLAWDWVAIFLFPPCL
jgi:hypothetical protein